MSSLIHADSAAAYLARIQPFLLTDEPEYNLLFGVLSRGRAGGYYARLETEDRVDALAVMIPPHKLILSKARVLSQIEIIARDLVSRQLKVPAVFGPEREVDQFRDFWIRLTQCGVRSGMRQGIYVLEHLVPPNRSVPGRLRVANGEDGFLEGWFRQFLEDTHLSSPPSEVSGLCADLVNKRALFIWETEEPVSMAAVAGPTPNGVRINMVFTPRRFRKRGFASACVAQVSREIFSSGKRFCFLYTDLANPTSNRMYQKLGYRHVSDWAEWYFL